MKKEKVIIDFLNQILEMYEFQLYILEKNNKEKVFKLTDLQGGNLGDIESEEFKNLGYIIDRLDAYHNDYIYRSIEEREWKENEIIDKNDFDYVIKRYIEDDIVAEILLDITAEKYCEIILPNDNYRLKDIINILDNNEKFYKDVCKKYIETMSKEMLIIEQNMIKHIFIEDEFIEFKEKGKINSLNYKKYLDGNYEINTYKTYQELFNLLIKDEILYDVNDLGLFEDNNWNFYISFDEFKRFGCGYVIKEEFPLLSKYIVNNENMNNFFNEFSLSELKYFEQTLNLYYETEDIVWDNDNLELYSKSGFEYEEKILKVAEGLLSYEEFMEEFKDESGTFYNQTMEETLEYFKANNMKNLMEYGADYDEGLYKLSELYKDILKELDVDCKDIYTEDGLGDGEYFTTITFNNNKEIKVETNGWSGIKTVIENLNAICESYQNNILKIEKVDKDIDYDF